MHHSFDIIGYWNSSETVKQNILQIHLRLYDNCEDVRYYEIPKSKDNHRIVNWIDKTK